MKRTYNTAFTLVELLVVIAIIGVLISLLLPAIQAARESARRAQCISQMRQLILAVDNFDMAHEYFPSGTLNPQGPIQNLPNGQHISWIAHILPYLDEPARYSQLDLSLSAYHQKNDPVRQSSMEVVGCPSSPIWGQGISGYAGCHHDIEAPIDADNNGVFFRNSRITRDDLRDGAAYTIFIGEKFSDATDLGWLSGTPATLRNVGSPLGQKPDDRLPSDPPWRRGGIVDASDWPLQTVETAESQSTGQDVTDDNAAVNRTDQPITEAQPANAQEQPDQSGLLPHSRLGGNPAAPLAVGGFGSYHPPGVSFAFGDGSVRFVSNDARPGLLRRLANRADGQLVDASEW